LTDLLPDKEGLHIQMFSIHGLVRGKSMELGYDADTGGQIKYVVEVCNALSQIQGIEQVDLFTRLIRDKSYSNDYSLPLEQVNDKFRIVRIQC
jgi:sucrose-phosphate synthase